MMPNTITSSIRVKPIATSRLHEVDMNNVPFGRVFSDHMLVARYENGSWQQAEISPYQALPIHPSISALNYGQSIFEGMKAHRSPEGEVLLFRPEENFKRINYSAARMCMPQIPEHIFMDGLKQLIDLDRQWVPTQEQGSLYIRPLYFASDEYIGVRASENYIFCIFTGPVGLYYPEPVSLLASTEFVRAVQGGTGSAKVAGNYGAAMYPDKLAKDRGYNNVLWLDAKDHTYVEECGTMNIFFVIDGVVVTPKLSGTILQGITRASLLRLFKSNGYRVEERPVSIYEIEAAHREGRLQEAFGAGTAATVSHIARIGFNGYDMILPPVEERRLSNWVGKRLADIKFGVGDDTFGWTFKV